MPSVVTNQPILAQDLDFLSTNPLFNEILQSLSNFGSGGRYYNLDIVTQHPSSKAENYDRIWEKIESKIASQLGLNLMSIKTEAQDKMIYSQVYALIIRLLEQFVRALSRLLIKSNLGKQGQQNSVIFNFFLLLRDENLGQSNYSQLLQ